MEPWTSIGIWEGVQQPILQAESIELGLAKDVSDGSQWAMALWENEDHHSEVVLARERLRRVRQMHAKQRQQDQLDRAGFSRDNEDA
jgi:hypothetical protein